MVKAKPEEKNGKTYWAQKSRDITEDLTAKKQENRNNQKAQKALLATFCTGKK
jgi:hypothetical protein